MIIGCLAVIGSWPVFGILLVLASLLFGYLVPKTKAPIFANAATTLPRKVLDEYFPSWTPQIAEDFFGAIGPEGRAAYRRFYLIMDFWFPGAIASLTTASLLLIHFPGLGVRVAMRHRCAGLAARRRRERHAFSNGWQLPKPVVQCRQLWTAVDAREVGIRHRASADCAGWTGLSVPSRTLMAR